MALDTATIIKGTVGVLGVSGLGFGGYYGIQSLNNQENKETIEKHLEKSDLRKLARGNNEWTNIFASYQTVSAKDETLKFSGGEVSTKEDLQTRCEEILSKNTSEDSTTNNYLKKAKKWCIVPTAVSDGLKGRRILKTDENQDAEDQADWNKKIQDYTKTENTNKIDALKFDGAPITNNVTTENRKLIKKECKKLNETKNYQDGYEVALEKSTTWCTLPKTGG